ncbi:MAG TPA: hypothetical protein RMH85_13075 [Polyangiaceae bacterium LLY-WYZ-15_(1-7)]|nr:hypothetical protein [Sandaracinus sp.]HJL03526.1 hypothetical protein [Polyangiaceae bacterium LLY-WYZ-15_(1-7)]MBJ70675.1 hypothetical protein [Sandaracinus sp.]HJL09432.1 hypothetical protein [Polyangiaceae bacterium LLY-WYZ-15_(1-7)]HJL27033.1 hypothetical protein [Polyangiaceae bacterium LLY-WYZ-15_(1-7)]
MAAIVAVGSIHGAEAQRDAAATAVAIGATSAPERALRGALRQALAQELPSVRGVRLEETRRARYVLRGAVTRMDVRHDDDHTAIDCEVSLIVAERRRGTVRMMLSGRASARGDQVERLRESVVRAAVRGALRPLGQAVATAR